MESKLKIAVSYEDGQVFQHFGHFQQCKVYEVKWSSLQTSQLLDASGSGHGALAEFLKNHGVTVLLCGGIGGGAREALASAGITLYPGVHGDADQQVQAFISGTLQYDPDTQCHHHHDHREGHCHGHTCSH